MLDCRHFLFDEKEKVDLGIHIQSIWLIRAWFSIQERCGDAFHFFVSALDFSLPLLSPVSFQLCGLLWGQEGFEDWGEESFSSVIYYYQDYW